MRLIAFLLEVPSPPLTLREGGRVFAGWLLLFLLSHLAVAALLSVRLRWLQRPTPPRAYDAYLMALSELESERRA